MSLASSSAARWSGVCSPCTSSAWRRRGRRAHGRARQGARERAGGAALQKLDRRHALSGPAPEEAERGVLVVVVVVWAARYTAPTSLTSTFFPAISSSRPARSRFLILVQASPDMIELVPMGRQSEMILQRRRKTEVFGKKQSQVDWVPLIDFRALHQKGLCL